MTDLKLCIHGHFYQPPRENPFTGAIPDEPGAEPFKNFNEKIHDECYKPNAELGNLDLISFNFGPTLANWLEKRFPTTYQRAVAADQYHQRSFGVGNSMAQAYNHAILPLARERDKTTQIAWGIADFQHRFGRRPQGMWLPEMAADLETLAVMESQGLQYTILCPHQVRTLDGDWVDNTRPYFVRLPNGRQITILLRDEQLSNRLAFDPGLTADAAQFARWCRGTINGNQGIFLIATDGETFGHHQPQRQFFLQSLLRTESPRAGFEITTPGRYLQHNRPTREVTVIENTAWSCGHGVARWSTGCLCTPGDQQWKSRLRTAFDRLAGGVDALYESECRRWIDRPWALRDSYINVLLIKIDGLDLLQQFAWQAIPTDAAIRLLRLLDAERYCQAMYTSCGWYFEDLSRIETRNNIGYAAMAVEQAKLATSIDLADSFRSDLAVARSWITDESGRDMYDYVVAQRQI
jgi:alpha-amylase/alpha-mannosidase (GH57 family)